MPSTTRSLADQPVSRRLVLGSTAAGAALVAVPATSAWAKPQRFDYPFTLGVASGDPEPTTVVLWTRLAPKPFDDGHGMRGLDKVDVRWEVATDEGMRQVVKKGKAKTYDAWAHSVHVEAKGLQPGREYFYRFEAAGHVSPVGRTRTAPAPGSSVAGLSFATVSCQAYDHGYFTSYPHIVADDPAFVMHLGDYVYEYEMPTAWNRGGSSVPEITRAAPKTLREWRARHALYKADPDQQEAHRLLPFIVTWDDHEYWNDYAGGSPNPADGGPSPSSAQRRTRPTGSTSRCVPPHGSRPARSASTAGWPSATCSRSTCSTGGSSARSRRAAGARRMPARRRTTPRSPCWAPSRSSGSTPDSTTACAGTPSATT